MRKDKSGDRFKNAKGESTFVPRKETKFNIGPNSSPRKVARWFARGGGVVVNAAKAKARHKPSLSDRRAASGAV